VSAPGDLRHLPDIDAQHAWATLEGNGLDTEGLPILRTAIAAHLTRHQHLPTDPEQIVITAGAQEALRLLNATLPPADLVTTCPTYLGLADAFENRRVVALPTGPSGPDPNAIARAARAPGTVVYLMPTGHNPTGTVLPALPRQAVAAIADAGRANVVEDLTLADLYLDGETPPPPLAALSTNVVAVGSAGKLLWGGLRVGWIRADEPLRSDLLAQKAAASLATAATTQAITARLLTAIDAEWLAAHRIALARRRDHLIGLIGDRLPGWRAVRPAAGLSLWVEVPVDNVDAFAHTAARHGVVIAPGRTACVDGRHHGFARVSFAEQFDLLTLAVDRLAVTWEAHSADLAAGPARRRP
jgi:DNA-binding transcriptional MocR family regulator